jgi:CheY-like chemotaxis protein
MAAKILYIDDIPEQRYMVKKIMATRGFEVTAAANGPEGIAMATRIAPDVVIVDLMMPYMDGIEVIKALRTHPATATVPIVALTVLQGEETARKALEAGANIYISKPVAPDELERVVRGIVIGKGTP